MGILEVVMLALMGRTVVLGTDLGMLMVPGSCRWAKSSHLQHNVHKAGIEAGNVAGSVKSTVDYVIIVFYYLRTQIRHAMGK